MTATTTLARRVTLVALLVLTLLGVWMRMDGLSEQGIAGSDTVLYSSLAQEWANDSEAQFSVAGTASMYRPVPLFLFQLSYRLVGDDAALKRVNVAADLLSIALVFWLAWLLCRNAVPALCAAASYSLLPRAIDLAREELVHSVSTFLVLLASGLALRQLRANGFWTRPLLVAASGLATGLAVLSHEELVFIAPVLAAFACLDGRDVHPEARRWRARAVRLLLFLSLLVAVSWPACLAQADTVAHLAQRRPGKTLFSPEPGHVFLRLLHDAVVVHSSMVVFVLFASLTLVGSAVAVAALRRRDGAGARAWLDGTTWSVHLPAMVVVVYTACCSVSLRYYPIRVFSPMMPLVLLAVFVYVARSSRPSQRWPVVVLLLVVASNVGLHDRIRDFPSLDFRGGQIPERPVERLDVVANVSDLREEVFAKAWPREIYDHLEGDVSAESRLLVTPAIAYSYRQRRVFQLDCYFGDDAVYVVDHDQPLGDLIAAQRIRYVVFQTYHLDSRLMSRPTYRAYRGGGRWQVLDPFVLGAAYGFKSGEYRLGAEWRRLRSFLKARSARLVASDHLADATKGGMPARRSYWIWELPPDAEVVPSGIDQPEANR